MAVVVMGRLVVEDIESYRAVAKLGFKPSKSNPAILRSEDYFRDRSGDIYFTKTAEVIAVLPSAGGVPWFRVVSRGEGEFDVTPTSPWTLEMLKTHR